MEKYAEICIQKGVLNEDILEKIKTIYPPSRLPNKIETYKTITLFGPKGVEFDEWCKTPVYTKEKYDEIISCEKLKKEIKENKNLKIYLDQTENYEELYPLLIKGVSTFLYLLDF